MMANDRINSTYNNPLLYNNLKNRIVTNFYVNINEYIQPKLIFTPYASSTSHTILNSLKSIQW